MSSSPVFGREESQAAIDLLKDQLAQERQQLIDRSLKEKGKLDPEDQQAVRVIESKIRMMQRKWDARFATGAKRAIARAELDLDLDNGELFEMYGRKHRRGSFDCTACALEYPEDDPVGPPVRLNRLCNFCHKGIQHCQILAVTLHNESMARLVHQCEICGVLVLGGGVPLGTAG